jgi:hypothetical protein
VEGTPASPGSISSLLPDEYTSEPESLAKLHVTVGERVAAAQRMLDARGFRSLLPLGSSRPGW